MAVTNNVKVLDKALKGTLMNEDLKEGTMDFRNKILKYMADLLKDCDTVNSGGSKSELVCKKHMNKKMFVTIIMTTLDYRQNDARITQGTRDRWTEFCRKKYGKNANLIMQDPRLKGLFVCREHSELINIVAWRLINEHQK